MAQGQSKRLRTALSLRRSIVELLDPRVGCLDHGFIRGVDWGKGTEGKLLRKGGFGGKPSFSSESFTGLRAAEWQPGGSTGKNS
jgi:hypothetical protein